MPSGWRRGEEPPFHSGTQSGGEQAQGDDVLERKPTGFSRDEPEGGEGTGGDVDERRVRHAGIEGVKRGSGNAGQGRVGSGRLSWVGRPVLESGNDRWKCQNGLQNVRI